VPDVLDWYHLNFGVDNFDYAQSPDRQHWQQWKGEAAEESDAPDEAA
jgi:phenol hydroxylase P3 protein